MLQPKIISKVIIYNTKVRIKHGYNFARGHYGRMMKIYLPLAIVRDILLPHLMSGELAIADVGDDT